MSSNSEKGRYTQAKESENNPKPTHPLTSRVLELMRQQKRKETPTLSGYFLFGLTGKSESKKPKPK